ncbi:MAG: pilus assembly protein PilB, partial [bacterium]
CKESYTPKEEELMELALTPDDVRGRSFYRGAGCDNCYRSGYRGRSALFEIMAFTDEIRDQIMKKASTNILKGLARRNGMRSLRECGLLSIYDGQTTIDEVVRETLAEED